MRKTLLVVLWIAGCAESKDPRMATFIYEARNTANFLDRNPKRAEYRRKLDAVNDALSRLPESTKQT